MYREKKNPDDGQRNCPKHVQFYSRNKFGKLVHLFVSIIMVYHDARSSERQIKFISQPFPNSYLVLSALLTLNVHNIRAIL